MVFLSSSHFENSFSCKYNQALLDGEQAWTSILNLKSFVIGLDFAVHAHCTIRMECTMLHWFLNQ